MTLIKRDAIGDSFTGLKELKTSCFILVNTAVFYAHTSVVSTFLAISLFDLHIYADQQVRFGAL